MWRRYALVRQSDGSDCGAAALATVALHYRRPVGLQPLRDLAGTDRRGTTLQGLARAAEQLGFSARGVKGPLQGPGPGAAAGHRPRADRGRPALRRPLPRSEEP